MGKHGIIAFLASLASPLLFFSCSENDEEVDEFADWRNKNETYFSQKFQQATADATDDLDTIRNYTFEPSAGFDMNKFIVVKKLENGTGSGSPMFTDSVLVNYRGYLTPSPSYNSMLGGFELGYVFDQSFSGEYNPNTAKPAKFLVSALTDGFCTALQNMRIGDRWLVCIPYTLAYGTSGQGSIPGYSTLVFDISLVAYYRAGTPTGQKSLRKGRWVFK